MVLSPKFGSVAMHAKPTTTLVHRRNGSVIAGTSSSAGNAAKLGSEVSCIVELCRQAERAGGCGLIEIRSQPKRPMFRILYIGS
jgi:hypothetical protein